MAKLIIAKNVLTREQLAALPTPEGTKTHFPIPHIALVEAVEKELTNLGFTILEQEHGIARDGARYFGGMVISGPGLDSKIRQLVVGLRNSHDKSFPAALCIGNRMMVCENLCFSSDEKLERRHTSNIMRDLPMVVAKAIARLMSQWADMEDRITKYRDRVLTGKEAADLVIQLVDKDALPPRDVYKVVQLWRNPELAAKELVKEDDFASISPVDGELVQIFESEAFAAALAQKEADLIAEFGGLTLWGLYNGLTFVLKGSDLSKLPFRTIGAQTLFDTFIGRQSFVEQHIGATVEMAEEGEAEEALENLMGEAEVLSIESSQS